MHDVERDGLGDVLIGEVAFALVEAGSDVSEDREVAGYPNVGERLLVCHVSTSQSAGRDAYGDVDGEVPATAVASGYRNFHWSEDMIKRKASPYRATIVWPIRGRPSVAVMHPSPQLLGFLCVDSPREGTFNEVLHVPTGEVFARALYSALRLYRETQDFTQPVAGSDGGRQLDQPRA